MQGSRPAWPVVMGFSRRSFRKKFDERLSQFHAVFPFLWRGLRVEKTKIESIVDIASVKECAEGWHVVSVEARHTLTTCHPSAHSLTEAISTIDSILVFSTRRPRQRNGKTA